MDIEEFYSGNRKFDFTIVDEIDLSNPEALVQLATSIRMSGFKESTLQIKDMFGLSVESDHEDEKTTSNLSLISMVLFMKGTLQLLEDALILL